MAAALTHSTVVVAAYASDAGGSREAASSTHGQPVAPPPPAASLGWLVPRAPTRRLVGFARAASDCTLVALVADVAVAAPHRGAGVGRRLMFALLDELRALGIADVGALTPDSLRPFFT